MKKTIAVLLTSLLAGCGLVKGSKQFAEFDLETVLKEVCRGEDCRLDELSKGVAESASFTKKTFKYMVAGESISLSGVATSVMKEIEARIDKGVFGHGKYESALCVDCSLEYEAQGNKGFVRAVFVKVAGGVLVMVDLRETD